MMSKKIYLLSPAGTSVGAMLCSVCGKPIDDNKEDFCYWKSFKGDDWKYVTTHRTCASSKRGWEILERKKAKHDFKVLQAVETINSMDWDVLYDAVKNSKHKEMLE